MRLYGGIARFWIAVLVAFATTQPAGAEPAAGEDAPAPGWRHWVDNDYYRIQLNVRTRIELADFDGLESSEAYTMRTRLGIGSKPFGGFSAYAEMENIFSIEGGNYFDLVESPTGQSPIADPEDTELNRLWLQYAPTNLPYGLDLKVKAGRQRIKFDDDRFVGNVGWRQNEQTYDAVLASTSLGVDDLTVQYGFVWDVRRIFGDHGSPGTRDFDSESHLIRVVFDRLACAELTAFAYLLDFDGDSPVNSSNSYGFRVVGERPLAEGWTLEYAGSYAYQTDAADNPVDYGAHYGAVEAALNWAKLGELQVGFEHLGSDRGKARFVTPLATGHKFNGYADTFLDNGGTNGLQDLYVSVAPKLPWGFKGRVAYHHFWADSGGSSLGDEIDVVLSRPIVAHVVAATKFAYFDGDAGSGLADRWRWWLQLTFAL
jgi:hypothetical protein